MTIAYGRTQPTLVALSASRFDAVIFDMDGVVTDTAKMHAVAWKRTFDRFLRLRSGTAYDSDRPFDDRDYVLYVDGKHRDDGVAAFLRSRGIELPRGAPDDPPSRETVWGLANRKNDDFQRIITFEGVRAFPTSVVLVEKLKRAGIGIAIISASRNCQRVLDAAGIGDLFPIRVDGVDMERLALPGKPAPAVFIEAARRLRADRARSVVIEDAIAGVRAGHDGQFGFVLGVARDGSTSELLAAGADAVVQDLGDVDVAP